MLAVVLRMRRRVNVRMGFQEIRDPSCTRPVVADHEDWLASLYGLFIMVSVAFHYATPRHWVMSERSWLRR